MIDEIDDPVLAMLGVGKELWQDECGDAFIERLRSDDDPYDPNETRDVVPAIKQLTR